MPLAPVQQNGLKLWTSIQLSDEEGIAETVSEDFTAKFFGDIDGNKNEIKADKTKFVAMSLLSGKSVHAIGSLQFEYGTARWGKKQESVYLIRYKQDLVFTPTQVPDGASDEQIPSESIMHSKGLQIFRWIETNGLAQFTHLYGFEADKTNPLQQLQQRGKLCNVIMGDQEMPEFHFAAAEDLKV